MRRLLSAAAFLLIPSLIPSLVSSQTTATDSIPRILQQVDSGASLRVRSHRQTVRGAFSGMSDDALVLSSASGAQVPIRFDVVEEIWKQGHYAKRGAIIGGATGAAVLTAFGLLIVTAACETDGGCSGDYPTVVLYSVGIGGGLGALVGGGLGYMAKRWAKIY